MKLSLKLSLELSRNIPRTKKKKPNATVRRNALVTRGAPSKRSISIATTRYQSAAKRRRLDLSSAAEADVLLTDQGADTLARADIPRTVDAVLRSLPHSSTVMPTNDARTMMISNLKSHSPTTRWTFPLVSSDRILVQQIRCTFFMNCSFLDKSTKVCTARG